MRLMALAVRGRAGEHDAGARCACSTTTTATARAWCCCAPGNPPTPVPVERRSAICDLRDVLDGGGNVIGWKHEDGDAGRHDRHRSRARPRAARRGRRRAAARDLPLRLRRAPIGGGEYERTPAGDELATQRTRRAAASRCSRISTRSPRGGRLLIEDSLTYAQTPMFKVDGVTGARRAGPRGGGGGAQPAPAADRGRRRR